MSQIFLCGIFISPNKSNKNEGNNNARQALQDEEKRAEERQRERGREGAEYQHPYASQWFENYCRFC